MQNEFTFENLIHRACHKMRNEDSRMSLSGQGQTTLHHIYTKNNISGKLILYEMGTKNFKRSKTQPILRNFFVLKQKLFTFQKLQRLFIKKYSLIADHDISARRF